MKYLDLTLPTPQENLACDEALLDAAETGVCGEVLRCWESREHFVVVGYANRVASEIDVAACKIKRIPIYRRCSGGGTVLQGPGCLNYALILRIGSDGPTRSISTANRFVVERNRAAIQAAQNEFKISVCGHTDLVMNGLKFSGNSQRRRKRFLLFHGTFLLNLDLSLVSELLPMPSRRPDYRENRPHAGFLTNLNVPATVVKAALQKAWNAELPLKNPPLEKIAALACGKYASTEWNFKF
jgi:lipoate-protein ligase A